MICPICKDDLLGRTRCASSYCEGYRDGRDETEWRALLERDVAEVEFRSRYEADEIFSLQDAAAWDYRQARTWNANIGALYRSSAADFQRAGAGRSSEARERLAQLADCERWLARARAVLG